MTASDGAFSSPTEAVTGTLTPALFNALSQGTHTIYVHGEDAAGNWGTTTSATFLKDTVNPSSSATSPPYDNTGTIAVDAHASDPSPSSGLASVDLYVKKPGDSGFELAHTNSDGSSSFSYTVPTKEGKPVNGSHSFYTIAHDKAGNDEGAKSAADTITLEDTIAPTTTDNVPAAYVNH